MAELPTIEGFRVLEELGSGSLSSVYKAVEESLGRFVALKILNGAIALDSPFAAQLEREARVLSGLCHTNIGVLYALLRSPNRMVLVLEYVDGFSLGAWMKKRPDVPPDAIAAIGAAVARGLSHAHERGVVHRDVKPANILVSKHGEIKLFDFGIAQQAREHDDPAALTPLRHESIAAFGTPAYMSPEQILGEGVDARSDLFSLGVVLYQLVCGARPFERGDESDARPAAHRIRRDPPIPLHRRAPDVPPALERVVMRSIQKLPADRFQTAEEMADELAEIAAASSGLRPRALVVRALERTGLVSDTEVAKAAMPPQSKRRPLRRAVVGLALLGACALGGGAILQQTARRQGESAGAAPLNLVPVSPGYLRVLATPWAEVRIDGERIDETPFARAIPLAKGVHYVTLVHPNAPIEKRTIDIEPGETTTIDVVMGVPKSAPTHSVPEP